MSHSEYLISHRKISSFARYFVLCVSLLVHCQQFTNTKQNDLTNTPKQAGCPSDPSLVWRNYINPRKSMCLLWCKRKEVEEKNKSVSCFKSPPEKYWRWHRQIIFVIFYHFLNAIQSLWKCLHKQWTNPTSYKVNQDVTIKIQMMDIHLKMLIRNDICYIYCNIYCTYINTNRIFE